MCLLSAGRFDCKNCEQKSDFKDYKPFLDVFWVFLEFDYLSQVCNEWAAIKFCRYNTE